MHFKVISQPIYFKTRPCLIIKLQTVRILFSANLFSLQYITMFFKRVCRKLIKYRQRLISHTCLTLAVSPRHSLLVLLLIFNGSQKEDHLCVLIWIQWYSLCKSCRVFRKFLFAVCLSSKSGLIFTGAGPVVQNLKLFGGTTCFLVVKQSFHDCFSKERTSIQTWPGTFFVCMMRRFWTGAWVLWLISRACL